MADDASGASRGRGAVGQTQKRPDVITLVLAESYPILLEGLDTLFRSTAGISVLACCKDGDDAWRAVQAHRPDVLVLDLRIRGKAALEVLREITALAGPTRAILLAECLGDDEILEATRLGARGIVLKTMDSHLLVQCVRKVHRGVVWIEKVSMGRAFERLLQEDAGYRDTVGRLSARELEVVRLVARGHSNKKIADTLCLCEGTVKSHLHHVYEKLGVRGRIELLLYARDKGLLSVAVSSGRSAAGR